MDSESIFGFWVISNTDGFTTTASPKSKGGKSKSSSKDGGAGYGDCDCDKSYGMVEMRLLYSGSDTVDISYVHKDGDQMCLDQDVATGEESSCDISNSADFEKYGTNTYVTLYTSGTLPTEICTTKIHTLSAALRSTNYYHPIIDSLHYIILLWIQYTFRSCSSSIVGETGDGDCGDDLVVTGWRDGNPNDNNDCDDGTLYIQSMTMF